MSAPWSSAATGAAARDGLGALDASIREDEEQEFKEFHTRIVWASRQDQCLNVMSDDAYTHAILQLGRCDENTSVFIVPPLGGTGTIRVAGHEHLCLDMPGGTQLQFWRCGSAPREHMLFRMPDASHGRIRSVADPPRCLDVPSVGRNGTWLQLWDCHAHTGAAGPEYDRHMDFLLAPAQAGAGDAETAVAGWTVENVNYNQVKGKSTLFVKFEKAVEQAISADIGAPLDTLAVELSSGPVSDDGVFASVNVDAFARPAWGVSAKDLQAQLASSSTLPRRMLHELSALDGIEPVLFGPIRVFARNATTTATETATASRTATTTSANTTSTTTAAASTTATNTTGTTTTSGAAAGAGAAGMLAPALCLLPLMRWLHLAS